MERLIDALPGVTLPVAKVTETLMHMWDADQPREDNRTDFRASQLNLILHFGLPTTPEEARTLFDAAIRFAQTYPSRIIVLCPVRETAGEDVFEGKLFSQCYMGRHLRELCCCEALVLGYSPEQSDFLESQVSIWLESDLPVYHWLHKVPAERIESHYLGFLKRCRKVVFDSAVEGEAYASIPWPVPERIVDLSAARSLPLRQHLGQFISRFPPAELVEGLEEVRIEYAPSTTALALHLESWFATALGKCLSREDPKRTGDLPFAFKRERLSGEGFCLTITLSYATSQCSLETAYCRSRREGWIRARFPSGTFEHNLHIEPLSSEATLGEALFFA
jgi:glucose-6-phosphate dehydrogenase assembly protein OpcA